MSIVPAAARARAPRCIDVRRRVDGVQLLARRLAAPRTRAAEPVVALHLGLERDDPLPAARGGPGMSWASDGVVAQPERCGHAGYRTAYPWTRRPTSSSWAPAPPGCSPRSDRRARRRAGDARLRPPAGRDRVLLGAGRARRRARGRRLAGAAPARTRWPPAAASSGARPPRSLCRRGARALPRPRGARRALRRRPPRRPRARARGRPRAAASSTRAAARPAAGSCASSRRGVAEHPAIEVLEGARAAAPQAADGRVAGLGIDDGRSLRGARRRSSPPAAPPRCGRARPTRRARSAPACCSPAPPAPTLADLEFVQFHPTAVVGVPRPRGLPDLRGGPRRGRHAARPGRRALRRRARAARRGRPRDLHAAATRPARPPSTSTCATSTPGASPTSSPRCARPASTRRREPVPVAPASHYVMGGIVTDLDGRTAVAGPLRGRRVRLHRPARRQPARLQLARRVLRVRPPRRARGLDEPPPPSRAPARPHRRRRAARRARPARRCGGTPAWSATPQGLARCSTTRTRSPASSPPARCPRGDPRRARAQPISRDSIPGLDERHTVVTAAEHGRRAGRGLIDGAFGA